MVLFALCRNYAILRRVHTRDANADTNADTNADANANARADASARTFTPVTQVMQAGRSWFLACVCVFVTSIHTWKCVKKEQTQAQGVRKKKDIFRFVAFASSYIRTGFYCNCACVRRRLRLCR